MNAEVPRWFDALSTEPVTLRQLLVQVCGEYRVGESELLGKRRHRYLTVPRHEFMLRAQEVGFPLREIGRFLGRDHTTILSGIRQAKTRRGEA